MKSNENDLKKTEHLKLLDFISKSNQRELPYNQYEKNFQKIIKAN